MFKDFSQPNNTQAQAEATFPREYLAILKGNPSDAILICFRHNLAPEPLETYVIPRQYVSAAWGGFLKFKESTPELLRPGFHIEFHETRASFQGGQK
jgi:hypothetical protein